MQEKIFTFIVLTGVNRRRNETTGSDSVQDGATGDVSCNSSSSVKTPGEFETENAGSLSGRDGVSFKGKLHLQSVLFKF